MKKFISSLLAVAMTLSVGVTAFAANVTLPDDVKDTDWCAPAVKYVLQYKLMDNSAAAGDPVKVNFDVENPITREVVAETIYRDAAARNLVSDTIYRDAALTADTTGENGGMALKEAPDYAEIDESMLPGVSFCFYQNIMTGDENHKMKPTAPITREEIAAVMQRYYKYLVKADPSIEDGMAIKEFKDYDAIQEWAREPISFCVKTEMLKGNTVGTFEPAGNVTRAQAAQIMLNLENVFVETPVLGLKLISQ